MKYRNTFIKILSAAILTSAFFFYQSESLANAAVTAENEARIKEIEAANKAVLQEKEAIDRAFEKAKNEMEGKAAKEDEEVWYYNDGTYEGKAMGFGGDIVLSVTIEKDEIINIEVLSHEAEDEAYYVLAEPLLDQIVEEQSIDIDTVSGATLSSDGILNAARNALEKAVNQ